MIKTNVPIQAYLTYYLCVVFNNGSFATSTGSMDFTKPLTQEAFDLIVNSTIQCYEETGMKVVSAKFIEKELYERLTSNEETGITISWGDIAEVEDERKETDL